ncbi:MAG TPA: POTRA domain-containing protein [Bacteroidales bacterium]|nr:POTRA domain-containing protein [Bacteroidales bacterium]HSA42861.1 POTRA domain-containing protein [Bacteroidales bacterium]
MYRRLLSLLFVLVLPGMHAAGMAVQADSVTIGNISFSGNRSTKTSILRRELLFSEGDRLGMDQFAALLEETRQNMLNLSLFNFVDAESSFRSSGDTVDIHFRCTERWYLWPFPVIEMADRNFNAWWQKGDMSRVTYGFYLQKDNFRGRREKIILNLKTGYDRSYGLTYEIPYLTRQQNLGLSLSSFYIKNHSVPYDSYRNKSLEIKDRDFFLRTRFVNTLRLSFRKGIHHYHYLSLSHSRYELSDTLFKLNPDYSWSDDKKPGFFTLTYRYKADFRDYQPYPLTGYYLELQLNKDGLDLTGQSGPNTLGARCSVKKYWKLFHDAYFASGFTAKVSRQEKEAWFLMKGLGYDNDYVRGYEYYVIDGQDFFLIRHDFRYALIKTKVHQFTFLPEAIGKIHYTVYLSLYTDWAYVHAARKDKLNFLADRWLMGHGAGLNIVTYYDKVFRLEFSRNHMGETGFFVSMVAAL